MTEGRPWSERMSAGRAPRRARVPWRAIAGGAGGVVALVVVVAIALGGKQEAPRPVTEIVAARSRNVLVEVGELRSSKVNPVNVEVSGEIAWLIEEGAMVGPEDVVARLDDSEVRARFEEKERETVPLRSDVERRRLEVESARVLGPLKVRLAEIKLALAEWALEDLRRHPTADELAEAQIDLRVAGLAHEKAKRELERTREAIERGLATDMELRQKKLAALDAEAEAQLARLELDILSAGVDRLTLESARLDVEKARLVVGRERFASEADIVIAEKDHETAKAYLAQAERQLDNSRAELDSYVVKAGAPGRVSFPEVWKYTKDMSRREVGETIHHGHDLCEVVDPSQMEARVYVNEADALSLRPGLLAVVRPAALPGIEIPGKISDVGHNAADKNEKLGRLALAKSGRAGVSVVEVKVELDNDAEIVDTDGARIKLGDLRGGHTVTVEIMLDDTADERKLNHGDTETRRKTVAGPRS